MKLYHGSFIEVREPRILIPNRTLDFGYGFYTTTNLEQARQWVNVRKRGNAHMVGYINVYDFANESIDERLSVLRFDDTLIRELKTYTLVDQVLFHTQNSLQALTFIEAKEVNQ